LILVAGLGITGQSVIQYLQHEDKPCIGFDTRQGFSVVKLQKEYPKVKFYTENLPENVIAQITQIILSPGISTKEAWLTKFLGISIIGDIELFAQNAKQPIVSITGSNGKSTVTSLVAQVLTEAGYLVGMGGNIGVPALNLLVDDNNYDIFVLELSSFQLETTNSLHSKSATILNICEDHMDRYNSLEDYKQAKMRIFQQAELIVLPEFDKDNYTQKAGTYFGGEGLFLAGKEIMPVTEMALQGEHHLLNAQATVALTSVFNILATSYKKVFKKFKGLEHRTQVVAFKNGVKWINDSKGTNVGATLAAIKSLASKDANIILIAGGVGKESDFSPLKSVVNKHCKYSFLFGRDASLIQQEISGKNTIVTTLSEAVNLAKNMAKEGDTVLFSPACASFDQFKNYIERGEAFKKSVKEVLSV